MLSFLDDCHPPLKELTLQARTVQLDEIIQCLRRLPDLRRLRVNLDTLPPTLCPLLEDIMIDTSLSHSDALEHWSAAEDMIRSRWRCRRVEGVNALSSTIWEQTIEDRQPGYLHKVRISSLNLKKHPLYRALKDYASGGLCIEGCD